jgi:hypothetical protein
VEKNSCFVRRNANIVSKEGKIRCVLTDEWRGTFSWTRTCLSWLW